MKTVSFAVPCYNSAEYMNKCVESLLTCGNDIEILLVDDGSFKDNTAEIADEWERKHPEVIRAIHKPNGGHGSAVNTGLAHATGLYFKVVDSDDWLDKNAAQLYMGYLRSQLGNDNPTDMVVANYVYEKVYEGTHTEINYRNVFPVGRRFTWSETKRFMPGQYLLMHSVTYRTDLLKRIGLELPEHCFYVDNIFVYVPLPFVDSIYYLDTDLYRYFIGREGQSVNEDIMMSRIDQQLRVTRYMIDAVTLPNDVPQPKLRRYMTGYLSMMMCICSFFLRKIHTEESEEKREAIWNYLEERNPGAYKSAKHALVNLGVNIPSEAGRLIGVAGYRLAQKIFKFN